MILQNGGYRVLYQRDYRSIKTCKSDDLQVFFLAQAPKHVLSFATNENNNESPDFSYVRLHLLKIFQYKQLSDSLLKKEVCL